MYPKKSRDTVETILNNNIVQLRESIPQKGMCHSGPANGGEDVHFRTLPDLTSGPET